MGSLPNRKERGFHEPVWRCESLRVAPVTSLLKSGQKVGTEESSIAREREREREREIVVGEHENYLECENARAWCWHEELKDKRGKREDYLTETGRTAVHLNQLQCKKSKLLRCTVKAKRWQQTHEGRNVPVKTIATGNFRRAYFVVDKWISKWNLSRSTL